METNAEKVASHYNRLHELYMQIYGDVIQAYRPSDTDGLLEYLITSMGVENGMRILDVGAGFCTPSIFFCQRFNSLLVDALTVSEKQADEAEKRIKQNGLENRINVKTGDFHFLTDYFSGEYDIVFFLESLGHASNPEAVMERAIELLKDGGRIYIKDFFRKSSTDENYMRQIDEVINKVNAAYVYNVLHLEKLLEFLRMRNMEIEFIRKPLFKDDRAIPALFEEKNKLQIHTGNNKELVYAEWLEIRMFKRWK